MRYIIKSTICSVVFAAALAICAEDAYAFGYPTWFEELVAEGMRTYTVGVISKKTKTKDDVNRKIVEETVAEGNSPMTKYLYKFVDNMDWGRFGEDPFGTVTDAAEKTKDREIADATAKAERMARQKIDDYLKEEEIEKEIEEGKDAVTGAVQEGKDAVTGAIQNAMNSGDAKTAEEKKAAEDDKKFKNSVIRWLSKNRPAVKKAVESAASGEYEDLAVEATKEATDAYWESYQNKKDQNKDAGSTAKQ